MKLVVCIVHNRDKNRVTDRLVEDGFKFTIIGSTGGFLREGNTTFLIGIQDEEQATLLRAIEENSSAREQIVNVGTMEAPGGLMGSPVKVPVGGSVVFIMNVEQFARF